jgi:hypothetical protein
VSHDALDLRVVRLTHDDYRVAGISQLPGGCMSLADVRASGVDDIQALVFGDL